MAFFKKYSPEQKFRYHKSRARHPAKHKIKFNSAKHLYSDGFVEAFYGRNNVSGVRYELGSQAAKSYATGYKFGLKAANQYFKQTGKQPSDL